MLRPKGNVKGHVARIGYAAPNFPRPLSFFDGEISEVRFYKRALNQKELSSLQATKNTDPDLVAHWKLKEMKDQQATASNKFRSGI